MGNEKPNSSICPRNDSSAVLGKTTRKFSPGQPCPSTSAASTSDVASSGATDESTTHAGPPGYQSNATRLQNSSSSDGVSSAGTDPTPISTPSPCTYSLLNIQGLRPQTHAAKVEFINNLLDNENQLFIALSETWLHDHNDAEINIPDYILFRQDRQRPKLSKYGRHSGGVALYTREDISGTSETLLNFSNSGVDVLAVHVKPLDIVVIVVYRQPDVPIDGCRSTHVEFTEAMTKIRTLLSNLDTPSPDVILCGDFNLPHANWHGTCTKPGASTDEKKIIDILASLASDFFLTQCVDKPTRRENILDLIFTNNEELVNSFVSMKTDFSDHNIVECKTYLSLSKTQSQTRNATTLSGLHRLNFFNDDIAWTKLKEALSNIDWNSTFQDIDIDTAMEKFIDTCYRAAAKHVPERRSLSGRRRKSKIPRSQRILFRKRSKLKHKLINSTNIQQQKQLQMKINDIDKTLKASFLDTKYEEELRAVNSIRKNPKYFYSYVKKFTKTKTPVGPLNGQNGDPTADGCEMANLLADQYSSVFSTPKSDLISADELFETSENDIELEHSLIDIDITREMMIDAIDELSPISAAGPDGFPAILLKNCKEELVDPLMRLWRRSLDRGVVPRKMKCANIVPIFKGGNRNLPRNYRPIALTSHLVKIFEKVLRKQLVAYLEKSDLLNPGQHGFRGGRSCLSQLLEHYDKILKGLESGMNVDVIYLDFAKAFDKVDFGVTMEKMKKIGIGGNVGKWIYSFLTDRCQTVIVEGMESSPKPVISGVPQGSVLGPILFLILISDIDGKLAHSTASSFADDTRITMPLKNSSDSKNFQSDLSVIFDWAENNNMQFNCSKFECLRYGPDDELKSTTCYKTREGKEIEEKHSLRDLGVTMSDDCTFSEHISKVVKSAKKTCSWILRTFNTRAKPLMMTLWKALVLPIMDYCSQLWNPASTGDIQTLEMVQRSFIRKIDSVKHLDYWQQLQKLRLYSLQRRRERYIIIYMWRILEGQVPNIGVKFKFCERRGRECLIPAIVARGKMLTLRDNSLSVIGPRLFNALPTQIRNIAGCNLDVFKKALDNWLNLIPDQPLIPGYTAYRIADSNSLLHMSR